MEQAWPPPHEMTAMAGLLKRVRPNSRAAALARSILAFNKDTPESIDAEIAPLVKVGKYSWRERRAAVWSLGLAELTEVQTRQAGIALARVVQQGLPISDSRTGYPIMWSFLAAIPAALILDILKWPGWNSFWVLWFGLTIGVTVLFSGFLLPFSIVLDDKLHGVTREMAITALVRLDQPWSLATFAWAMFNGPAHSRAAAEEALVETLPLISSEQFGQHDPALVPLLCRILRTDKEHLQRPVVQALAKIGTGRAVEPLEQLAKHCSAEVRAEIDLAVPILRERKRKEEDPERLLRASRPSADEELLRAHYGRSTVPDEQLLRPGDQA